MKRTLILGLLLGAGAVCYLLAVVPGDPGPLKAYLVNRGTAETGALNLVTAIYLGYRAFDTLGETIVLILAVMGVNLLFVKNDE